MEHPRFVVYHTDIVLTRMNLDKYEPLQKDVFT